MRIDKYTVPDDVERQLLEWMKLQEEFTTSELAKQIENIASARRDDALAGCSMRLADRLMTHEKKRDHIEHRAPQRSRGKWRWKRPPLSPAT